jgi:hypothetical protein
MRLLDQVRRHAAAVAAAATYVHIEHTLIDEYVSKLPLDRVRAPELDAATHYLAEPEGTLAYVVQLDAINFGSGYFPRLTKRPGMSGYFTVAASLKDYFEAHGPLSTADLQKLNQSDVTRIFGQDAQQTDPAVAELMELFTQALNDLGGYVEERFGGSFHGLIDSADGSAERLAGSLAEMPFYRDVGFYKRAQLTAADLATAGVAEFDDLDRLTIFADNLVPHVLRVDGILSYEAGLLERINQEELIPKGSREELEIRAAALHAVELIATRTNVTSMQLDYLLWNRGQEAAYKALPRHRTRTVFY